MTHTTASRIITVNHNNVSLMTFENKTEDGSLIDNVNIHECACGAHIDQEIIDLFECCVNCGTKEVNVSGEVKVSDEVKDTIANALNIDSKPAPGDTEDDQSESDGVEDADDI